MTPDSPPPLILSPELVEGSEAQLGRSLNGRRPYRRPRVRAFYPVPTRTRRDGWTVQRQADFLGLLAETGSVIGACEAVGISRKSAYRLRALPGAESFAAAWDAALGMPTRKVTPPARDFFHCDPAVRLVMFRGRYRGAWYNAANGALVAHEFGRDRVTRSDPDGDSAVANRARSARPPWPARPSGLVASGLAGMTARRERLYRSGRAPRASTGGDTP